MAISIKQLGIVAENVYNRGVHESLYNLAASEEFLRHKGTTIMIKNVNLSEVPARTKAATAVKVPEIKEVLDGLNKLPKNSALSLTLSPATKAAYDGKTKGGADKIAERVVVGKLNRLFKAEGLTYSAYTNDDATIFVIRVVA